MAGTDVALHVALVHTDEVTDAAAEREHPLLLVHMTRHVADKLGIQLRLEITHMAAGRGTDSRRKKNGENQKKEALSFSVRFARINYQIYAVCIQKSLDKNSFN